MSAEIWKPIPEYEGFYEVSDLGRVRSLHKYRRTGSPDRILAQRSDKDGRQRVHLSIKQRKKTPCVHTLVLVAFSGSRPKGCEVSHKDGNPKNNKLANLEWTSHSSNMATVYDLPVLDSKGMRNPHRRLEPDHVRYIRTSRLRNADLARKFGVVPSLISGIKRGKKWTWLTE